MITSDDLLSDAAAGLPDVVALRRAIHRHPELGLQLPRTQAAVLEALDGLGLDLHTGVAVTSVVADLRGERRGTGRAIVLRADMDALPMPEDTGLDFASTVDGSMHSCGHDAHTAMLVGAARILASRRKSFSGTVRFAFQPGEEGFGGAQYMINEGLLTAPEVDAAFALHVTPNLPVGTIWTKGGALMASADGFELAVVGKGGHASSPYLANDPMPVAAEIVQALQVFVTRRINTFDPAVITITQMIAGTTGNVIPERVDMVGTVRAVSETSRRHALAGLERVTHGIAAAHEMRAEVTITPGYPVTVNDDEFATFALRVAGELLGPEGSGRMPAPVMGAEDFSYVLQECPGAMAFLGVCPPDSSPARAHSCHSNQMMIHEDALATGSAMYAAVALEFLT